MFNYLKDFINRIGTGVLIENQTVNCHTNT